MSFLDLTNVEESKPAFTPLPIGSYLVMVDNAEVKETKAGTGAYISLKLKVLGPTHEGKFLFHTFNIKNPNSEAVKIGLGQLKTFIKTATYTDGGKVHENIQDVLDFVGLRAVAVVKHKTEEGYGTKAVVSYFKPKEEAEESKGDTFQSDIPF